MSFRTAYGYTHSENGWRMCNRDECVLPGVLLGLPFTDTAPVRSGVAATILGAWLVWYHRNVEPISSPVWGWSAENLVPNSNHLSGTALDINAPKYPWGYRTMPADRIAKVREGLRLFEGTVYWGADWSRADEMHYQIGFIEGDRRLDAFAKKLESGYLGIYGEAEGDDDLVGVKWKNHLGIEVDASFGLQSIDKNIGLVLDQLCGPNTRDGADFPGWDFLGGDTVPEAIGKLLKEVRELRAEVKALKS
ncbi:Uncharacterised protein [Nocardia farcinica]|uniref:M15 family metallopeptidase n=1 Tax=Nocardia farcinica TaxID=37329 RepID=UPI000DFACCEA|nr:M15 family metallopeptidase [Nocardia farcinica]SUE29597.1 Uncharacterised protein [Nocardia farcinica]